jgi:hypothetical protein
MSSSGAININKQYSTLWLSGGFDEANCNPNKLRVDLRVAGGALIKKTLCVLGNIELKGILNGPLLCANISTNLIYPKSPLTNIAVAGNLILDTNYHIVSGFADLTTIKTNCISEIISGEGVSIQGPLTIKGNSYIRSETLSSETVYANVINIGELITGENILIQNTGDLVLNPSGNICLNSAAKETLLKDNVTVSGNLCVIKTILTDCIGEKTLNSGVKIDGILVKDGVVYGNLAGNMMMDVTILSNNIVANSINMTCGNISNVQALFVDQMFGKNSPINVENTLNIRNNESESGNITFEGGISIGNSTTIATHTRSIAVGKNAISSGTSSIAIGESVQSTQTNSISIGYNTISIGNHCIAIGIHSEASYSDTIAIGYNCKANIYGSVGIGKFCKASKGYVIAIGSGYSATSGARAFGYRSIALGTLSNATQDYSIAIGSQSSSTADEALAIGSQSSSTAFYAVAIGQTAKSTAIDSIAIGRLSEGYAVDSIAIGRRSRANRPKSIAIGTFAYASPNGSYNIAIGSGNNGSSAANAHHDDSIAIGRGAFGGGVDAVAFGRESRGGNTGAIGIGRSAKANNITSIAIGHFARSYGVSCISIGKFANASNTPGPYSAYAIAIGGGSSYADSALANGVESIAIGRNSNATESKSISFGSGTTASAADSLAIGGSSTASADNAVAIGSGVSNTVASTVLIGCNSDNLVRFEVPGITTQSTSNSTGVTLDKAQGVITMFGTIAATTVETFTLTNSRIQATSVILLNSASGTNQILLSTAVPGAGSVNVHVRNIDTSVTSSAPVIHFHILYPV